MGSTLRRAGARQAKVGRVAAGCAALWLSGCGSAAQPPTGGAPNQLPRRALYAAFDDGSIHVYDIDDGHREVESFPTVAGVSDVRGLCASAATGALYLAHKRDEAGYVVAVDARTGRVLYSRAYQPNVDRLSCRHDGRQLFVPSNEAFTDDSLIVVDTASGDEITRIVASPRPHDCLDGPSGVRIYLETKSSPLVDLVDAEADAIVGQIGPFADIVGPFTVDSRETRLYANVFGVNGFQVADLTTGAVVATASLPGETAVPGQLNQHGIALSPDETEVWVNDGAAAIVHVYDATQLPPVPKVDVALDATSHWVTFSIAGDYAYVSGPKGAGVDAAVIDARTHERVASIGPSEDMLEIDFAADGSLLQVGDQFGVGRVASPPP
jgi:DNA-binding beta-propeller fold protein YncE